MKRRVLLLGVSTLGGHGEKEKSIDNTERTSSREVL